MELHTPFAVLVAWELGHLGLRDAVMSLLRWPVPATLRLRSIHVPPTKLSSEALVRALQSASHADRCADMETLAEVTMTPFLRDALGALTAALGGRPFKHGLLQLGLRYLPLRRDPPGTYDRLRKALADRPVVILNPYNVAIANVPAGLRAVQMGFDIHIGVPRDRMARLIIHPDGSATMSSAGTVLRSFLRLGRPCITDSVVGALPAPPRTLAWSLTEGTLPPDTAAHLGLLRATRRLFLAHAPPSPLPPPVKRQRDLELHLCLLDALWRADLDRVARLLDDDGAPILPPYHVPKCVRAHVYTDRGPRILDVLHNAPDILGRALQAGLWLPLTDAALWIVRRPADLDCILDRGGDLDATALLETVLVHCDATPGAPLTVLPTLIQRAAPVPSHLALVRRRPDLFHIIYAAVGSPVHHLPDCLDRACLELVPTLLDLVDVGDVVRDVLMRRPDLPQILRQRPRLGPALLDHIIAADLDEAFAALITDPPPSADVMTMAIAAPSPRIVAHCIALGCPVTTAHIIPLIEASELAVHPMFWPVAQHAPDRVLHDAFRKSVLPCCFALALADAGITDARLMTCVRDAGLYFHGSVT